MGNIYTKKPRNIKQLIRKLYDNGQYIVINISDGQAIREIKFTINDTLTKMFNSYTYRQQNSKQERYRIDIQSYCFYSHYSSFITKVNKIRQKYWYWKEIEY